MLFRSRRRQEAVSTTSLSALKGELSGLRSEIQEDLGEHFLAINQNTNELEIQNNFICEIDNRITKMEERVDEIHLLLRQLVMKSNFSVQLTKDEQRVFLILYTHEKYMKTEQIAAKSLLDRTDVEDALTAMMDKGIPLDREVIGGIVYVRMNSDFKLRQAKEKLIKIDPEVTSQFQNALLKQFFEN